jgi:hypothetical protein
MISVNTETSKRLAAGASALALLFAVTAIALTVSLYDDASYEPTTSTISTVQGVMMSVLFVLVGGTIALKRPGNLIGWSMLISGTGVLAGGVLGTYAELALLARPEQDLPGGFPAASLAAPSWTPLMAGIFLLIILFPTGRVPSRRWRLVAPLVLVSFAMISFMLATAPADYEAPFEQFGRNRLAFYDETILFAVFPVIFFCLGSIIAAIIDLIVRFRRSHGVEREQYKWLALSAGLLAVSLPFGGTPTGVVASTADVVFSIGLLAVPISVGIAVMRYRLYEIDRIINRALVYGLLTGTLGFMYFGLVVALQALLSSLSGGNDLAIVATTLLVAALFLPARRWVQEIVNRRFNRRAYDAARTIDDFSARLRDHIDMDTLRYELLAVIDETMQPARASLWLRKREAGR